MNNWIAVDWGTTHLRAYLMRDAGILDEASSQGGMNTLTQDAYEAALLRLVGPWLSVGQTTEIIACGMVGSHQGWQETPYRTTPCTPLDLSTLASVPTTDTRLHIRLIPGLRQNTPADVMRGKETQIAGVLALHPQFDGVICLPGTHSKWAYFSAGEVVSFEVFIFGVFTPTEAFAALHAGADDLKLFPGNMVGPGGLKALRAVLPIGTRVYAVGGSGPDNFAQWRAASADGFGLGTSLYTPGLTAAEVSLSAKTIVSAFDEAFA